MDQILEGGGGRYAFGREPLWRNVAFQDRFLDGTVPAIEGPVTLRNQIPAFNLISTAIKSVMAEERSWFTSLSSQEMEGLSSLPLTYDEAYRVVLRIPVASQNPRSV